MSTGQHIDFLLQDWRYEPESPCVRLVKGADGRDILQLRVDLGILQLETTGRPDGLRPSGHETLLDMLCVRESQDPDFELDEETCIEIDREFVQFFHRRVSWLRLQRFEFAISDADHTLAMMDFCREHSPCEEWTLQHEQHRAFVVFHRSQAAALQSIEEGDAEQAIEAINDGLELIRENFEDMGWEEMYESDELVCRLAELRESLREDFNIGKSLKEQFEEAVQSEEYELAAELRDRLTRRDDSNC